MTLAGRTGLALRVVAMLALCGSLGAPAWGQATPPAAPAPAALPVVIYTKDNAPKAPKLEALPLKESVSQYGITWTFEKPARVGQFINGDFYVVGATTVKMIDPKPLFGDEVKDTIDKGEVKESGYRGKEARNGSSLNPTVTQEKGGFDSRIPARRYDPELFSHLPIAMKPGDSLVSSISRPTSALKAFDGQHVDPLQVAAVLTCLADPQPADAFRPSYCDSANSKIYLARNLHRDLFLSLPRIAGMPEDLAAYAAGFQKPWLDLVQFGFAAPVQNLPHYGQQMVEKLGSASLLLLSDYPAAEKEALLVNMTQAGIDFWGLVRGGRTWGAHGGLNSGRKWLIIQAGLYLGDEDLQSPNKKYPKTKFHEDDQTAFGPVTFKGKTYERSWSGAKAIFMGHSPGLIDKMASHWADGWGPVDLFDPNEWPKPGMLTASTSYRLSNTSGAWVGEALAARMMHAEKVWDHDAFFAYVDRWMTEDDMPFVLAMKAAGRGDQTGRKPGEYLRSAYVSSAQWVKDMWLKYRDNLPPSKDGTKTPKSTETWK